VSNGSLPAFAAGPIGRDYAAPVEDSLARLVLDRGIWTAGELMKLGRCPFCEATRRRQVAVRADGLPLQECFECGLAYIDPRPSSAALSNHYNSGYFTGEKDFFKGKDYCQERDRSIQTGSVTGFREIAANFDLKGKKVLDIGCASGALLASLKPLGPKELVGIDTTEYPTEFGAKRYGLDLRCGTFRSMSLPGEYFDLVTLIDVIEHVEDLNDFLSELRRVVKPSGSIFIITPNYLAHSFTRDQWACLYQDFEHLHYFSAQSLDHISSRAGYRLAKSWTDSFPFRVYDYPRLYQHGVHRLFHPGVAARNGIARLRYKQVARKQPLAGGSLNAILRATVTV
jgi:2-polyprenyl-3-methyl-5-hydroxy-6-metoxy-1,4-benzoquinol methylase